jgi:hypothetical protein
MGANAIHLASWLGQTYIAGMPETLLDKASVDRTAFSVRTFAEAQQEDLIYWRSRTPDERLAALEFCRQIAYGYDPTARRLSRFLEVVEFKPR